MRHFKVYIFKFNIKGLVVLEATQTRIVQPRRMTASAVRMVGTGGLDHQPPWVLTSLQVAFG